MTILIPNDFLIGTEGVHIIQRGNLPGTTNITLNGVEIIPLGFATGYYLDFAGAVIYAVAGGSELKINVSYTQSGSFVQRYFEIEIKGYYLK